MKIEQLSTLFMSLSSMGKLCKLALPFSEGGYSEEPGINWLTFLLKPCLKLQRNKCLTSWCSMIEFGLFIVCLFGFIFDQIGLVFCWVSDFIYLNCFGL